MSGCIFSTHINRQVCLQNKVLTVSIAVVLLGIFIQMNIVTVYYADLNCKNKLFAYKYCIK